MDTYLKILEGLPVTLGLSALALSFGLVVGIPLMLARRSHRRILSWPTRSAIDLLRAIPPIVWLFIIFFGLPDAGLTLAPFTAAWIGMGMIAAAYLAEAYRGGVMAIDRGQWEAGHALGLHNADAYRFVIGPQAFRVALPSMATFAIALMKDTSIAYTIGVHEVMFRANSEAEAGAGSALDILIFTGIVYAALSIPTAILTRRLDAALRGKVAR